MVRIKVFDQNSDKNGLNLAKIVALFNKHYFFSFELTTGINFIDFV